MAQHQNPLTGTLGAQTRFVTVGGAKVLGTLEQRKAQANTMARLEGTGKDPRYGKGEIFDVPKYKPTAGDLDEREINPVYQELLDKKFAKEVDPKDDPGRTLTQIADAKVSRHDPLSDPVDAAIAADMTEAEALAIVQSGDPSAKPSDTGKPDHIQEGQSEDPHQVQQGPAYLGQPMAAPDAEEAPEPSKANGSSSSGASGSSGGSGS